MYGNRDALERLTSKGRFNALIFGWSASSAAEMEQIGYRPAAWAWAASAKSKSSNLIDVRP
jgi:hypothetical protein